MLKKQLCFAALSAIGAMSMAHAGEFLDDRCYVAPFGTFVQPGGDRNASGGWVVAWGLEKS